MKSTFFLLIRHGQYENLGKFLAGRTPGVHLNHHGKSQASSLTQILASIPIHAIYSSPLERALETAEELSIDRSIPIFLEEKINEIDFGYWTGLFFEELKTNPDWIDFNSFRSTLRAPHGETMFEVQSRALSALEEFRSVHPGETVVVFSHADIIRSLLIYFLGASCDLLTRFEVHPCSISTLEINKYGPKIHHINYSNEFYFKS